MHNLKIFFFISLIVIFLSACSSKPPSYGGHRPGNVTSLGELKNLEADSSGVSETSGQDHFRYQAIKDTAMSVGAQAGLAWRSQQVNAMLENKDGELRHVFDFNSMILSDNVLPPVLSEGRDTLKLDDPNTIRLSDRTYKIISQARFVTTPPNWREYLMMNYAYPARPDNTLLPKTRAEKAVWDKAVEEGWYEGIKQANTIYEENLARLKRDFKGMALYRSLLAQQMVSMPFVAKANLGITGGGENMRINDQVLRITALPSLQPNSNQWKPAISPGVKIAPIDDLDQATAAGNE